MCSRKLYSEAARSGSSDENVSGQDENRHSIVNWLSAYQDESEEIALKKAIQLSKVTLFLT